MRLPGVLLCVMGCVSISAFADGPSDRRPTDPHAVESAKQTGAPPLAVEALLTTTRSYGVAHSNDGRKLAYISDASGRPNLWIMNVDGSGAQQLIHSDDRQASARFSHDDTQLVYSQDRGGNEKAPLLVLQGVQ